MTKDFDPNIYIIYFIINPINMVNMHVYTLSICKQAKSLILNKINN